MTSLAQTNPAAKVSVVIPTLNGGPLFREVLEAVFAQECPFPYEVICIDSGSTDGTAEHSRDMGARVINIPRSTFNHGLTRNLGIEESQADFVALLVQDATPVDSKWLFYLTQALLDDENAAGAYSRQVPRDDCNPFIRGRLLAWAAGMKDKVTQKVGAEEWETLEPLERLGRIAFDDVASMVRRSIWKEFPYLKRDFGEDLCFAKRTILAGHHIVFEPRSQVIHSHNNSIWYEMRRLYSDHDNLHDMVGLRQVPSFKEALRAIKLGIKHWAREVKMDDRLGFFARKWWLLKTIPFSVAEAWGKYLGGKSSRWTKSSAFFRQVDRFLRKGV